MRLPAGNSGFPASLHGFLPWLLLGGVVVDGLTIPRHELHVDHGSAISISIRDFTNLSPHSGAKLHHESRAPPPIIPKPKPVSKPISDPLNPTEPGPPEPLAPNDPVNPKAPGGGKPTNPGDSVSAPADVRLGQTPPKANPKPDPYGPIPTEAEIATLCSIPENKAIFWSGTRDKVHDYKMVDGLISDSQAYPKGYSWTFRGIDAAKNTEFAYRFSRVFARTAKGEVRLMVPWETGPNPTRTFHTDEWPILKEGMETGRITKIIQVNPNNWKEERIYDPSIYGLTRREAVDLNNVPWDVNLDALDEAWKRANPQSL